MASDPTSAPALPGSVTSPQSDGGLLVLAPPGGDLSQVCELLRQHDIAVRPVPSVARLCELAHSSSGLIIDEAALTKGAIEQLQELLRGQPEWSDLPVLVLVPAIDTQESSERAQRLIEALGNVTVVELPLRVAPLVTAARAMLRARSRQNAARHTLEALREGEEALRLADRRKDQFLAMLGHELRNPMAAVTVSLGMLERVEGDLRRTAHHRQVAERQMQNLKRLVDDLLDVSRITLGAVELKKQPVDLRAVVDNALTSAQPLIDSQGHQVHVTFSDAPFRLLADPLRLEQVVVNLLSNAAKYTPPGGHIFVSLCDELSDGQNLAVLKVRDTGRGIPADQLERIFDIFIQVDQTIDRQMGGLGLGLSLVKALATLHGGTVDARSAGPDQGTEVTVRLPLDTSHGRNEVPHDPVLEPRATARKRRIVLVEDSPDIRDSLAEFLEVEGHEVAVAANGLEGVERLLQVAPDVALVDVGLPGIDGYEVARRVRERMGDNAPFLVALTGYGGPEARAKAEAAGFDMHLTKPVRIDDLPSVVNRSRRAPSA